MAYACDAIIFDLDGVLVDSTAIAERHVRAWAKYRAISFESIAAVMHGRTTTEMVRWVAPHLDPEAEARSIEAGETLDTDGLVAFAGAQRLLTQLPRRSWAIATSSTRDAATRRLERVGLPVPSVLIAANDVLRGKPDSEPYLLVAKRLGVVAARCVVVEDAPAGIASARAAGARVIGIASTTPHQELMGADVVVACLDDLSVSSIDGTLRIEWRQALSGC